MGTEIAIGAVALILGVGIGFAVFKFIQNANKAKAGREADELINEARRKAEDLVRAAEVKAKDEAIKRKEEIETERRQQLEEIKTQEKRLTKREDSLDQKLDLLERKEKQIEKSESEIGDKRKQAEEAKKKADQLFEDQKAELYRISGMNANDARDMLLKKIENDIEADAAKLVVDRMNRAKEEAEERAREVITTAIQRTCSDHTADVTVSTVQLESDDIKGRVIGREGRNIRAFERATGVDIIVDDTPGLIVVSAFDPVRREVARRSLDKLIADGRIHPARIEEVVKETEAEVEAFIYDKAKEALRECDIHNVHKKIQYLLGRLHFRTSYGQNVLRHSVEVAHLSAAMAAEMGVDVKVAKRAGLLHDIGKAVDHEEEGGHPAIGYNWAKRFGEINEVCDAIGHHHDEGAQETIYAALAQVGDAISASRPGARMESLERYMKRMGQLEEIANSFEGVTKSFAIQAGREVRVLVDSHRIDDGTSAKMCRDIAKKIEYEMDYPGEVKITLVRETRVVEYAR